MKAVISSSFFLKQSVLSLLLRAVLLATPLTASVSYAETWTVNLQDADIKAFIHEVAGITKRNFVIDPRINGTVTVVSNRALSESELYELFLSVMQVNGVSAVDTGLTVKLVPENVVRQMGVRVDNEGKATGDTPTTRVIYLQGAMATDVLTAIRPLMPASAHAAAVVGINALVLSDTAHNLNQIERLISTLDSPSNDTLTVVSLRHVDATRMMELITALTSAGATAGNVTTGATRVIADNAADRLIIKGNPSASARIKAMIEELDTMPAKRLSGMRVFRLKYASSGHIAQILQALLANQSANLSAPTSTLETASLSNASVNTGNASIQANANQASVNTNANTSANTNSNTTTHRPFSIISDDTQNALIVNASPELMPEIEQAINELDTRRVQILIQAAIIEVSGDDAKQLGVQWALGNANGGYGVVNFNNRGVSATTLAGAYLAGTTAGLSSAATAIAGALVGIGDSRVDSSGNRQFYGAILQALSTTTSANLLSMPSILTLDNEKASILVGQNIPVVTGSYTTSGSNSNNPFQTIERQDIGINLNVIPHVGDNGTVRLEVSQEVSSVVAETASNINGVTTNKNLITTTVLAEDGQTIALGGLMRDNSTTTQQRVPGLGSIPVVGRLFRSDGASNTKSNLIIFLQPTILRDGGAVASVTERHNDTLRTMQLVIDKNGTIRRVPLDGKGESEPVLPSNYALAPLNPFADNGNPAGITPRAVN
ncbi:MAG: type II secretion system secretin GspD [Moraxella sp.]|nr:type II secretion system secretin GspD [Moraxella sp.]